MEVRWRTSWKRLESKVWVFNLQPTEFVFSGIFQHNFIYSVLSKRPQKKSQKRKFNDDNFDDEMDIEPQLKYKGNLNWINFF